MYPDIDTTCLVRRLRAGRDSAFADLVRYACDQLRVRARRMLRRYPHLRQAEQTDDVLNTAIIRLQRGLRSRPVHSGRHFWNRAAQAIRRSLRDMAREYRGRDGRRPRQVTGGAGDVPLDQIPDYGDEPQSLEEWEEFHETVGSLPEQEREVVGLLWYEELSQQEAADILNISVRTVKRRWQRARLRLARRLQGGPQG